MVLGTVGYYQAQSTASLYSGLIFGGLLVLSALGMFAGKKIGAYTALGATLLLTAVFSYRYAVTGKGMTALLAVMSAGMLLFLVARLVRR